MADETYKISIKGPGVTIDQSIDKAAVTQILSFVMTGSALPIARDGGGGGGGSGHGSTGAATTGGTATGLTAKLFLAQKKPDTLYERIACLGYYLQAERDTSEFGTKEIKALNGEAAQQPMSNLPQRIADTAKKYGFISAASGGKKQMTARGEAVVLALPDRERVKAAMAEHPLGKRRKKSASRKKQKRAG